MGGTDSYIRVLRNNSAAISYNTSLGYELCEGQEDVENQLYKLTRETFIDKTYKIRKAAQQVSGGNPNYEIVWEPGDYAIGLAQESEELFKKGPIRFLDRWENDCHIFYYPVDLDNPPFNDVEPYEVSPHKYYEKLKNKISR